MLRKGMCSTAMYSMWCWMKLTRCLTEALGLRLKACLAPCAASLSLLSASWWLPLSPRSASLACLPRFSPAHLPPASPSTWESPHQGWPSSLSSAPATIAMPSASWLLPLSLGQLPFPPASTLFLPYTCPLFLFHLEGWELGLPPWLSKHCKASTKQTMGF